jgi:alpha-tubulin suppressor-like RCC1 family protein
VILIKKIQTSIHGKIKKSPFLQGVYVVLWIILLLLPSHTVYAAAPVFDEIIWGAMPQMVVGTSWSYDFNATGADSYSISSGGVPGLSINSGNGRYSGTPNAIGSYPITISATNEDGTTSVSNTFVVKSPTTTQLTDLTTSYPEGGYVTDYPIWMSIQLSPADGIETPANAQISVTTGAGGPTCTVDLDATGFGECELIFTTSGSYTITAAYAGDTYYLASQDTENITVGTPNLSEALLAGIFHSCLKNSSNQVDCWGNEEAFPLDNTYDFVQFSAGGYHSCGLARDGSIECWGDSAEINQVPNTVNGKQVHFIQINSGDDHVCAIDSKYRLHCWGEMTTELANNIPNGQFIGVDAGPKHVCAIQKNNNQVVCWGQNDARIVVPAGLGAVKQVSVGSEHSCAIKTDDSVDCWGTGFPDPSSALDFVNLDSGANFSCGITTSGSVNCWGSNQVVSQAPVGGSYHLLGIGEQHACAVTSGSSLLNCWGSDSYGEAPRLALSPTTLPTYLPNGSDWSTLFTGTGGSLPYLLTSSGSLPSGTSINGLTLSGTLTTVGTYNFSLSLSEEFPNSSTLPIELLPATRSHTIYVEDPATTIVINSVTNPADVGTPVVVNVTVSKLGTPNLSGYVTITGNETDVVCQAAVNTSGQASCALYFGIAGNKTITANYDGDNYYNPTTATATTTTVINPIVIYPMISAGDQFNCSLDSSGEAFCWGINDSNQLIPVNKIFTKISAGVSHVCGIASTSKIYCWGWNGYGVTNPPSTPGFSQVSSGKSHSCGLDFYGNVTCWGNSENSRLAVPAGQYSQIDAGSDHTCAIRSDNNQVVCWGDNSFGQTGLGDYSTHTFTKISAGEKSSCGVLTSGGLACWGTTIPGQPISGSFTAVTVGTDHACALNTANATVCWGNNTNGEGIGLPGAYSSVEAGTDHNCAIRTDGKMKCWGNNSKNQAPVLSILPETVPVLDVNQTWNSTFSVIGGRTATYTYLKSSGDLPTGLVLDSETGAVSGTVTVGKDFTYTLQVFEQDITPALIAEKTYTQRVKADSEIHVTSVNPETPIVGQATWLSFTVNEADNSQFASTPTGQIHVSINGVTRCEPILVNGSASCLVFFDTAGTKSIRVTYDGDTQFLSSDIVGSETEFTVTPFEQTIQLRSGDLQTYIHRPDGSLTCIGNGCNLGVFSKIYPVFDSGGLLSCGLQTDGQITCLAENISTLYPGPFKDLSVGEGHVCALDLNGELNCWGENTLGQATPPAGVYLQVFAGENASCAIRDDNVLVCWGDPMVITPPSATFTDISIGNGFVCGLVNDGSITCWGNDVHNQLFGPTGQSYQQIQGGSHHTCALDQDGLITCWGEIHDIPVISPYGVFFETSAYQDHTCALRSANEITCWGENDAGEAPKILVIHLDDQEITALADWEHFFEPVNGTAPYTGTVSYGHLPVGLNFHDEIDFSPSGLVVYGKPTVPGRYDFALHWIDSGNPKLVWEELHRITVTGGDLAVEIQPAHESTALFDQEFWFDYVLTNLTSLNVPDVLVTIDLPDGFDSVTISGLSSCSLGDQQIICTISEFMAESSLSLRVSGQVSQAIGEELTTVTTITSTLENWPEVLPADNTDQQSVLVEYTGTILKEDFSTEISDGWQSGTRISSPSGEEYLGDFTNAQKLQLILENLAPHRKVIVQFKLFVIGEWQGNGTVLAPLPALYQFGQTGETALTYTTFCNGDCTQAYPGPYPGGVNAAQSGAFGTNILEFPVTNDAVYVFEYRFDHDNPTLDLTWLSENLPANVRFGVDDVEIKLDSGWEFVYLPMLSRP